MRVGNRILFYDTRSAIGPNFYGGVYEITTIYVPDTSSEVWTRVTDFDTPSQMIYGAQIIVGTNINGVPGNTGTAFGGRTITFTTSGPVTIGTTNLTFQTDLLSNAGQLTFSYTYLNGTTGVFDVFNLPYGGRTFVIQTIALYNSAQGASQIPLLTMGTLRTDTTDYYPLCAGQFPQHLNDEIFFNTNLVNLGGVNAFYSLSSPIALASGGPQIGVDFAIDVGASQPNDAFIYFVITGNWLS